ncbi:hypothetical protein OBBRIDRAFT_789681 [Obba rivulosa]|uniref:DUF7702 domain-containing protein n=1 Tax=Obba rivulosa TaxID=1052685 RepID=A0A8E2DQJ0_9APHY|nr:hypothetical protein OBBRIDRAFT_789681 [Obba rivulosa]
MSVNYAQESGIDSVAAAVIFCLLYVPLMSFYGFKAFQSKTYVHIILTFFCTVRMIAFAMRAALAGGGSAAYNENLLIGEEVIYSIGFFGLLYSAYQLVVQRQKITGVKTSYGVLSQVTSNLQLVRIAMSVAVALGIAGASDSASASASKVNLGKHLRTASDVIFLLLTILLVVQTVLTFKDEKQVSEKNGYHGQGIGQTHGMIFLSTIAFLLLVKMLFMTATVGKSAQNNEALFYPFSATTELIAVILFAAPGLVPSQSELPS